MAEINMGLTIAFIIMLVGIGLIIVAILFLKIMITFVEMAVSKLRGVRK